MKSLAIVVILAGAASADPAAAVVKKVQGFYAQPTHMVATFHQVVDHKNFGSAGMVQTSDGKMWAMKPTAMRADYYFNGSSKLKTRYSYDGTTFWIISAMNKEMKKVPAQNSQLPNAAVFLTGGDLAKSFDAALDASGKLELTPKQPQAYAKLVFVVDSTGQVTDSMVVSTNGETEDYQFSSVDLKTAVSAADFTVDPKQYPGYKLVP